MAKTKIALLYERLSRDDELSGESFSIQNQKIMLEDFARRNGYLRFKHFTDDGVSGTRFDRPGFMAMMEEVEGGNVEAIIVKDMSRMGRDYLKVGQVMEILRQRGVRLIAINDNVDTEKGDNDMTPFLNIMYEFYARDTSRKIKSVCRQRCGSRGPRQYAGCVLRGEADRSAQDIVSKEGHGCQSSALPKAYVEADDGRRKCSAGTGQSDRFSLEALRFVQI